MLDLSAFHAAVWRGEGFCNPVSPEAIDAALDAAKPRTGGTALDLGCGNGRLALRLAERGLSVTAVDVSPAMLELARAAAAESPFGGRVRFRRARAEAVLAEAGPAYDMIVAAGVHGVVAGATDPVAGAEAVARRLAPGGAFLFADAFWRRPPSAAARAAMPGYAAKAVYAEACAAAGLRLVEERDSSAEDWRVYFERMRTAVAGLAGGEAAAHRTRLDRAQTLWRAEADAVGFTTLLLFGPARRLRP